jgi:glucosylceramidase
MSRQDSPGISRRTWMRGAAAALGAAALPRSAGATAVQPASPSPGAIEWVVTTRSQPWQRRTLEPASAGGGMPGVIVQVDQPRQVVEGFGACFNELGWLALSALPEGDRAAIVHELFAPGAGGCFTRCRMPIGANDFSRDWYSYDETPGDFALEKFSVANDRETLIPFIRTALETQPDLKVWASPWSPPTWMKTNRHYAATPSRRPGYTNGLRPEQVGREGTDMFVQEEAYFRAYAAYFGKFVDAYRDAGIRISMVMPQNEFNSAQDFPSCTWTPAGLARFIRALGPEMQRRGVELFFGTMERADETLIEMSLEDAATRAFVSGAGFQWAGKGAIAAVHRRYPELRLYQTEQECGDGLNDWRYCRYAWTLMKHYVQSGASAYHYWNIALKKGGVSRWGWAQNSLVTVDAEQGTYTWNPEYYLLKHVSHFVSPGARVVPTASWTGYENQVAFTNSDGRTVVVLQNDMSEPMPVRVQVGGTAVAPVLPPDSFSTIVLRA